ncbi:MAG: hypothetical protein QOF19_1741, partial [Alphaproteobacteria bacterium]|nr:hypothetical protein [Alphaproteobacteria bacterium]
MDHTQHAPHSLRLILRSIAKRCVSKDRRLGLVAHGSRRALTRAP